MSVLRVAALFDIHGNLPALEAVLQDVRQAGVDHIVVGGDALPGPMPRETLKRLLELDLPVQFIHGNGELAVLAQMDAFRTGVVTYWGTTSGNPFSEDLQKGYLWTAQQLTDYEPVLRGMPKTLQLEIAGLGQVLFCHSTPRSETEVFFRLTPEAVLAPLFDDLHVSLAVCGHTHMQFDRMVGKTRLVNAGSIGEPFGKPGAFWALLGPDVQLRHTTYDVARAAELIRLTPYPQAGESSEGLLHPPTEAEILELFGKYELR